MARDDIEFFLQAGFVDGGPRFVVGLAVGPDIHWDMIPNPLRPHSSISRLALEDLSSRLGGAPPRAGAAYLLQDVRIAGHSVPDIAVRINPIVSRLKVDGILGLDFFQQFDAVTWHPKTHRVVLVVE